MIQTHELKRFRYFAGLPESELDAVAAMAYCRAVGSI